MPRRSPPLSAVIRRRSSEASYPGSISIRRPSASMIRNCPFHAPLPGRPDRALAGLSSTISTGTIFSSVADSAIRLRHASSVCTARPCAEQNSLRRSPLRSNSETRRSASARLRLRDNLPTPFESIPQLQHSANRHGRMELLERVWRICARYDWIPTVALHST
jgi:hypothetical protein